MDSMPSQPVNGVDSGCPDLFCPHCEYNLTGLPEDRCPECGEAFNRAALTRWTTQPNAPLTLGPDGTTQNLWSGVAIPSLFAPKRLARRLPPFATIEGARIYSMVLKLVIGFVFLFLVALVARSEGASVDFLAGMVLIVVAIALSFLCEIAIASILARLVVPRSVPQGQTYRFWLNLCRCFSSHMCLAAALTLVSFGLLVAGPPLAIHAVGSAALPVIAFLWWWIGLGEAIYARGLPSAGRTGAVLLIPAVVFVVIVLGYLSVILVILACSDLRR